MPGKTGQRLHEFDLLLCDEIRHRIQSYLDDDDPPFRQWVKERLQPKGLLKYVRGKKQDRLLFSDAELEDLSSSLDGDIDVLRRWWPNKRLHERYVDTVKEVRTELCRTASEDWSRECKRFARRLEKDRLYLSDGIEVLREWLKRLRRLLKAMHAEEFLPHPQGRFPTPTNPCPTEVGSGSPIPFPRDEEAIRRMLATITKTPDGRSASAKGLIWAAEIGKQRGLAALRELERRGQYQGFIRGFRQRRIYGE